MTSPVTEAYRALRATLTLPSGSSPRRIAVTAAEAGAPTPETVAELCRSLALAGGRVVALDCDLRDPALHVAFGLNNETGLTDLLRDGSPPPLRPVSTGAGELHLLAAGPVGDDASELIASDRFARLLDDLLEKADYLVMSAPAVAVSTDALLVAGRADAVLLVIQAGRSGREAGQRAVSLLKQVNAPLVGAVLAH